MKPYTNNSTYLSGDGCVRAAVRKYLYIDG